MRFDFSSTPVEEWLQHYRDEGFVILTSLYDQATLDKVKKGCNDFMNELAETLIHTGKIDDRCEDAPFDRRLIEMCKKCEEMLPNLYRAELHREEFHDFLFHENIITAVRKILDPKVESIRIFPNYSVRPKTPSGIHEVVWHQDAGLAADGGPSTASVEERMDSFGLGAVVNCWSPLVNATVKNGCMKFVPKSHKTGLLVHEKVGLYEGVSANGKKLGEEGDKNANIGKFKTQINKVDMDKIEDRAIDVELGPTDVVFFNNILVHRGGSNTTDTVRWSVDWRFQDAAKPTHRKEEGHVCWRKDRKSVV